MLQAAAASSLPDVLLTPFSLRRRRESKGISVPAHTHAEGMLVLVHEGLVMVQSGERVLTVLPGSLRWIPPGVTLGQWRQQARLLRALEMLFRGGSVTQAALSVGYESTSAFIGSFRTAFGLTPTRYLADRG